MGDDNNLWTTTQRKDERSVLSSLYFIFFLFLLLFFFFFLFIFHSLSLSLFTFFKGNVFQNSSFEITRTFSLPIVDTPISKEVFLINGCVGRVRTFIVSHFYSLVFIFLSFPSWKKSFLPRLPSSSNIFRIDRTNARLLPLFFARVLEKIVPIDIVVLFISYYFFFPFSFVYPFVDLFFRLPSSLPFSCSSLFFLPFRFYVRMYECIYSVGMYDDNPYSFKKASESLL